MRSGNGEWFDQGLRMVAGRAGVKTKSPAPSPVFQSMCHTFNLDDSCKNVPSLLFSPLPLKGSKTTKWSPSSIAPLVWMPIMGHLLCPSDPSPLRAARKALTSTLLVLGCFFNLLFEILAFYWYIYFMAYIKSCIKK